MSIIHSRAFRIPFKGQGASGASRDGELVLMPFMDAINHNYRNNVSQQPLEARMLPPYAFSCIGC